MKKLLLLLLVVGAAVYSWRSRQEARELDAKHPVVISNPVYAEVRVTMNAGSRSIEGVVLAKTVDQADCEQFSQQLVGKLSGNQGGAPSLQLQSRECKAALTPRNARLFDNEPTFVTYVSAARGERTEREIRWIYWGVTADESDRTCGIVPHLQKGWKGTVSCIRAART
ncbi:hypothetical protein GCM10027034_04910 [Ramlibacter solisilvae]|uniref:Uncharacterized protein n=1 Tax=Ramlibacter tataouinensis TaxID=94132 RepID=A0A127JYK8_9BURK|nr:hypothetical protein [Ramlibacter tataouinensis]AMO25066.1 hypothetical protein UC35_22360 [Ramlibacter tataouinensis]